jgi:hypothetical protein
VGLKGLLIEKNEAGWDRALRVLVGFILFWVFAQWWLAGWANYIILAIAAIFVLTGVAGHCTVYSLLGVRTGR